MLARVIQLVVDKKNVGYYLMRWKRGHPVYGMF